MAVTLSHQSALDAIREVRAEGINLHEVDTVSLAKPTAWAGKRLSMKNFNSDEWRWQPPAHNRPLHLLVPTRNTRMRGKDIVAHTAWRDMPAGSILWLDNHSSVVCPELLFLQMASSFSLPMLVMLGLELCGHYSRCASNPLSGDVSDGIPAATSVEKLAEYCEPFKKTAGLARAQKALRYICDHAVSVPEAVLAAMYALPPTEGGYGLGAVTLNDRVEVDDGGSWVRNKSRYPDLTCTFAAVGINYDGSKHFDVDEIMAAIEAYINAATDDKDARSEARLTLKQRLIESRSKIIDDNMRNRQLAAQGRIIFPATKEDLADGKHLDALTKQLLLCARNVFGIDTCEYERILDDTLLTRDRWELLDSLLPYRSLGEPSYGKM